MPGLLENLATRRRRRERLARRAFRAGVSPIGPTTDRPSDDIDGAHSQPAPEAREEEAAASQTSSAVAYNLFALALDLARRASREPRPSHSRPPTTMANRSDNDDGDDDDNSAGRRSSALIGPLGRAILDHRTSSYKSSLCHGAAPSNGLLLAKKLPGKSATPGDVNIPLALQNLEPFSR